MSSTASPQKPFTIDLWVSQNIFIKMTVQCCVSGQESGTISWLLTCFCSSVILSWCVLLAQLSLQELALDCSLLKALTKEVLRWFSSSVATVAHDWHNHLLVSTVVRKHLLEPTCQVEELLLGWHLRLKHFRLNHIDAHVALSNALEATIRARSQEDGLSSSIVFSWVHNVLPATVIFIS